MKIFAPLIAAFCAFTLCVTIGSRADAQGYGCQGGAFWNPQTGTCACPPSAPNWDNRAQRCISCGQGAIWNGSECACQEPTPLWDPQAGRCIARCSPGTNWDAAQGRCVSNCPNGQVWNGSGCECPPNAPVPSGDHCIACPRFATWDGSNCNCDAEHPEFHPMRWECWACQPGMVFDGRHCVRAAAQPVAQPVPPQQPVVMQPTQPTGFARPVVVQQPQGGYYAPVQQQPQQPVVVVQQAGVVCRPGAAWNGRDCICQPPTPVYHRWRNTCEPCPPNRVWDGRRCVR